MGLSSQLAHHVAMQPCRSQVEYTSGGRALLTLPSCSGVYRFFDADGVLLYIGKSVDVRARVRSHFADAGRPGRQQRMMNKVKQIDCVPTAGEVGALLLENAAIKEEGPMFNRRQRRVRRLWTIVLVPGADGFVQPVARDFAPDGKREHESFGLYHNRRHVESTLRRFAREEGLCLRVLGIERGRGPCFQHQLRRCRGACAGVETAVAHNRRLAALLARERILAWPFPGTIGLVEAAETDVEGRPHREWLLVNHWSFLGSFPDPCSARDAASGPGTHLFDRDAYRILVRALSDHRLSIIDILTGQGLENPFEATGALV